MKLSEYIQNKINELTELGYKQVQVLSAVAKYMDKGRYAEIDFKHAGKLIWQPKNNEEGNKLNVITISKN